MLLHSQTYSVQHFVIVRDVVLKVRRLVAEVHADAVKVMLGRDLLFYWTMRLENWVKSRGVCMGVRSVHANTQTLEMCAMRGNMSSPPRSELWTQRECRNGLLHAF